MLWTKEVEESFILQLTNNTKRSTPESTAEGKLLVFAAHRPNPKFAFGWSRRPIPAFALGSNLGAPEAGVFRLLI